jgi:uncharacterized protein (TIGR02246 family)
MPARKPQELHEMWDSALNSGDAEGLLQLCEEKAVFIAQPGQRCEGLDQIRAAIEAWIPLEPRVALRATHVVECGDLALSQSEWTLKATNPEGEPLEMEGKGTEVLRRQADRPSTPRDAVERPPTPRPRKPLRPPAEQRGSAAPWYTRATTWGAVRRSAALYRAAQRPVVRRRREVPGS